MKMFILKKVVGKRGNSVQLYQTFFLQDVINLMINCFYAFFSCIFFLALILSRKLGVYALHSRFIIRNIVWIEGLAVIKEAVFYNSQ